MSEPTLYRIDEQRLPEAGDLIVRLATATVGKEVVIDTDPPHGVLVPVDGSVYRIVETDATAVMPETLVVQGFTAEGQFEVRGIAVEIGEDSTP